MSVNFYSRWLKGECFLGLLLSVALSLFSCSLAPHPDARRVSSISRSHVTFDLGLCAGAASSSSIRRSDGSCRLFHALLLSPILNSSARTLHCPTLRLLSLMWEFISVEDEPQHGDQKAFSPPFSAWWLGGSFTRALGSVPAHSPRASGLSPVSFHSPQTWTLGWLSFIPFDFWEASQMILKFVTSNVRMQSLCHVCVLLRSLFISEFQWEMKKALKFFLSCFK